MCAYGRLARRALPAGVGGTARRTARVAQIVEGEAVAQRHEGREGAALVAVGKVLQQARVVPVGEVTVDQREEVVCRVGVLRARVAGGGKVVAGARGGARVDGVAGREEVQLVKEVPDLGRRLVDRARDGMASLGELAQPQHDAIRGG
eukprot:5868776-Prymnesium_polylepis.2